MRVGLCDAGKRCIFLFIVLREIIMLLKKIFRNLIVNVDLQG